MQVAPNSPSHVVMAQGPPTQTSLIPDPKDTSKVYKWLGGIQIILGLLLLACQFFSQGSVVTESYRDDMTTTTESFWVRDDNLPSEPSGDGMNNGTYESTDQPYNAQSGYWYGVLVIATGVLALASVDAKKKSYIQIFFVLSVASCILGFIVLGLNMIAGVRASDKQGWFLFLAALAGIECFFISCISTGCACAGLGNCTCCDIPPLYKDRAPPVAPVYPSQQARHATVVQGQARQATLVQGQGGQATVVQGQGGQLAIVPGQTGQQMFIQGPGGQAVVQGQTPFIQGQTMGMQVQPTIIQGQPMVVHGQGGVQIIQQPGYAQNIQTQGYMAPPPQYPQNAPPQQGNIVAPPPYQPHMQSQTAPSAPGYVTQNQAQGRESLVHKRNAQDYELPTTPDEENREHPFLREGNREHPLAQEDQGYEELPELPKEEDCKYEQLDGNEGEDPYLEPRLNSNDYEDPDEGNYEKPDKKEEKSKEDKYAKLGKKGKKDQAKQAKEEKYAKLGKKEKKNKDYEKLKKK